MPARRLPVRPNLDQLHRQAKELLRDVGERFHAPIFVSREALRLIEASGARR